MPKSKLNTRAQPHGRQLPKHDNATAELEDASIYSIARKAKQTLTRLNFKIQQLAALSVRIGSKSFHN